MDIYILLYLIYSLVLGFLSIIVLTFFQVVSTIWIPFNMLIGPLVGAFVGVLLGFKVNDDHRKKLAHERKLFFKNLLGHEIKKSITLLEEKRVNLLPVDGWNSLVNSGDMALFTHDQSIQLSDIYFEIQNYNYEAKRTRDAVEEEILHPIYHSVQTGEQDFPIPIGFRQAFYRSSTLRANLARIEDGLLEKLKAIGDWLNKV